jgi:hypothetical protein
MAGALGNLLIMLTADTAQATSDIGKAAHQVERDMATMQRNATIAGVAIADAVTAMGRAFLNAAKDTMEFGDTLNKMAQKTSFSVERLSEIAFAADLADVSMGQMSTALGMFNKVLADASKEGSKASAMFKSLGVDINSGPQVAFEQFAKAINQLPTGEQKVAAMRSAFGRSGDMFIPLIQGLDESTEKARSLGLVISKQVAEDSEKFNDALRTLQKTFSRISVVMLGEVLPSLTSFLNELIEGRKIVGSFADALITLGTINPFRSVGGNIQKIREEIESLEKDRERYQKSNADTSAIDQAIAKSKKQLEFLKYQQQQQALALPGGDTPGERARMGLTVKNKWPGLDDGEDAKSKKKAMSFEELMQKGADTRVRVYEDSERKLSEIAEREEAERQRLHQEGMKAYFKSIDDRIEAEENAMRLIGGFDEQGRKIKEETKKTNDLARDLGLTFTSAFEDAIVKGNKFSDVLRGIGQDLVRLAARQLVTDPMSKIASAGISQGLDWLMSSIPSFDVGTPYVPQDTLAMVHKGERIIPASQNNGMGGGPTIYADMRGASVEAVQRLEQMVMALDGSIEPRAVSAVADTRRRGGSMARSF